MHSSTRARLELLVELYDSVRRSTIRLLDSLSPEELAWQPGSDHKPAQWIFAHLAATEESRIYRRMGTMGILDDSFLRAYRSGAALEAIRDCPLSGKELHALLVRMKRKTGRFLKRIMDGRELAAFPDLLRQLEKFIFYEAQRQGQIDCLRRMSPPAASGVQPAEPGFSGLELSAMALPARLEPRSTSHVEVKAWRRRSSSRPGKRFIS